MNWFKLTGDERLGRCASDGCGGQPTFRLEADAGSNYCSGCKAQIEWAPTDKDVRRAWRVSRHAHNFARNPVLRLPLREPMTTEQGFARMHEAMVPQRMWVAEYKWERGWVDGKPAERIVASVPGTEISFVIETLPS